MLKEIATVNGVEKPLSIYDCRPALSAQANKAKGGGFESAGDYPGAECRFCGIDNIHAVSKAHYKLMEIASDQRALSDTARYVKFVQASGYLQFAQKILEAVNLALGAILEKERNVLVHCSDGWDRTGQLSGLTQIMLDPYFRTVEGFMRLIEKDWL